MKVRIYGFEWSITAGATIPEFLAYLRTISGEERDRQVLAIAQTQRPDGLWAGVLLTIKDQRAYAEFRQRPEGFVVTPRQLARATNIVDFNFFIVNPGNGRGLYQYYHQSAALSRFRSYCKQQYRVYRAIREIGQGYFNVDVIMRKEAIEESVRALRGIKAIEFEAITYRPAQRIFQPLDGLAQRRRHRYVFFKRAQNVQGALGRIQDAIIDLLRAHKFRRGRIEGYDENGFQKVYDLFNNPDELAEYEFDEVVQTVRLYANDLDRTVLQSPVIQRLIALFDREDINALLTVEVAP